MARATRQLKETPYLPHMLRMEAISAMTGRNARELYKEDMEKMRWSEETRTPVTLSTGLFDPKSEGFVMKDFEPGIRAVEGGGFYRTLEDGRTFFEPSILGWSGEAFHRKAAGLGYQE